MVIINDYLGGIYYEYDGNLQEGVIIINRSALMNLREGLWGSEVEIAESEVRGYSK